MSLDPTLEAMITEWNSLKQELAAIDETRDPLAERELTLRRTIVATLFPPGRGKEGTNYSELPSDWKLKAVLQFDRVVDEAALPAVNAQLMEMGVSPDRIVRWKPEVKVKEMRTLTAEQLKVFETALVIKPKAPTLELIPPKEGK